MKDDKITIILYGRKSIMSREEAKEEMIECMMNSEGCERDRYLNVYMQLLEGKTLCSDEEGEY